MKEGGREEGGEGKEGEGKNQCEYILLGIRLFLVVWVQYRQLFRWLAAALAAAHLQ